MSPWKAGDSVIGQRILMALEQMHVDALVSRCSQQRRRSQEDGGNGCQGNWSPFCSSRSPAISILLVGETSCCIIVVKRRGQGSILEFHMPKQCFNLDGKFIWGVGVQEQVDGDDGKAKGRVVYKDPSVSFTSTLPFHKTDLSFLWLNFQKLKIRSVLLTFLRYDANERSSAN